MINNIAGILAASILLAGTADEREKDGQFDLEPGSLARLEEAVSARGNPDRGREIFLDTRDAQCSSCHRLQGVGAHVGPGLDAVLEKMTIRELAEALLAPSRKLAEGYETYTAARTDGKIISGLKIRETGGELLLRDGLGKDTLVPRSEIARIEKSPVSLMPARLISRLSREDFVNLVSFLKSPVAQRKLRGRLGAAWLTGPFSRVINKPEPLEKNPDPAKVALSGAGKFLQWKLISARSDGLFRLTGPAAPPKSSSYLLGWLKSDKEREAVLWIDHSTGVRILVNSKTVYKSSVGSKNHRLPIRIQPGWNTILTRVANAAGGSTFGVHLDPSAGLRLSAYRQE